MPRDDRERCCRVYLPRPGGPDAPGPVRTLLKTLGQNWKSQALGILVVASASGAALLAEFALRESPSDLAATALAAVIIVSAAIALWIVPTSLAPRANWARWKRQLLSAGICPSCAYPLPDQADPADGCRVCPECGAAWRA